MMGIRIGRGIPSQEFVLFFFVFSFEHHIHPIPLLAAGGHGGHLVVSMFPFCG